MTTELIYIHADDPQANEEWTAKYQEVDADKELKWTLKGSFIEVKEWH